MKISQSITAKTWCKGALARTGNNREVKIDWPSAKKFCAIAWLMKANTRGDAQIFNRFRAAIGQAYISEWNDHPQRTFKEVREAFRRADL